MSYLYATYSFIFGMLIGSFLNVVIVRLPIGKDLVKSRSECVNCKKSLKWFHNIPVLSFLFLKGKCAYCGKRISWRYPLVEILTGLISLWLFDSSYLSVESVGLYFFYFIIACIFICHFFIDLDHHLLLDSLNLYLLATILPYSFIKYHWSFWIIGGAIGFGVPFIVTWLFYKIRGQIGLGGGDIKLFGILGILLGPMGVILTIFLSCLVGAIVGVLLIVLKKTSKEKPMAFGPAILIVAAFQIYFPGLAQKLQYLMFSL